MTVATFFVNKNIYFAGKICLTVSMLLLTIAFTAGWLFINKLGILSYNEEDTPEEIAAKSLSSIKRFFEGVGSNFLKTFAAYIVIAILTVGFVAAVSKLLYTTLGEPKLIYELPKLAKASSQAEILNFIKNISVHDKLVFSAWMLVSNLSVFFASFFATLYFAVVNFEKDNFIKAMWTTIKFSFKNFFGVCSLFAYIFAIYIGLNFVSLLIGTNSFSLVILIILFTIYLNYCVLLVFCFYNEKAKNNSNNRTELIG